MPASVHIFVAVACRTNWNGIHRDGFLHFRGVACKWLPMMTRPRHTTACPKVRQLLVPRRPLCLFSRLAVVAWVSREKPPVPRQAAQVPQPVELELVECQRAQAACQQASLPDKVAEDTKTIQAQHRQLASKLTVQMDWVAVDRAMLERHRLEQHLSAVAFLGEEPRPQPEVHQTAFPWEVVVSCSEF